MKLNRRVVSIFFLVWITLNLAVGLYVPLQGYAAVSIPYILVAEIINIGIAYEITLLLCASFTNGGDPPKLDRLDRSPRVALLYLCCNDAMTEALSRLNNQSYTNHQLFVLDDSTEDICKRRVDSYGYTTIRRGHRRNAKAGNLNHWLSVYGNQFEYFIVFQSERYQSIIENYWLRMVDIENGIQTTYLIPGYRIKTITWSPD